MAPGVARPCVAAKGDRAVPGDDDLPPARRGLSKGRMEGFSDGVFGFAATLLGVDLAIHPPGTALHQVLQAWPSYLAINSRSVSFAPLQSSSGRSSVADSMCQGLLQGPNTVEQIYKPLRNS